MKQYVIKYTHKPYSYFRVMTRIGPAFGASIEDTPRFSSRVDAERVIDEFPLVAAVCSSVEELVK